MLTLPVQFAAARSSAHAHTNGLHDDGSNGTCGGTLATVSANEAAIATITHMEGTATFEGHPVIARATYPRRGGKPKPRNPPFLCSSTACANYLHL